MFFVLFVLLVLVKLPNHYRNSFIKWNKKKTKTNFTEYYTLNNQFKNACEKNFIKFFFLSCFFAFLKLLKFKKVKKTWHYQRQKNDELFQWKILCNSFFLQSNFSIHKFFHSFILGKLWQQNLLIYFRTHIHMSLEKNECHSCMMIIQSKGHQKKNIKTLIQFRSGISN